MRKVSMSSTLKTFFLILKLMCISKIVCFPISNETHPFYDQRQIGKYNIHISLRDVAIIEVDKNEFSDETINNNDEYYYDDEDLTIRPISSFIKTTIKTPQIIVNSSLNSDIVDLHPAESTLNQQIEKHSASPRTQLTKIQLLESGLESNVNSSLFPSSERTTLISDMDASVTKEPVPSKAHLVYVPLHKSHKGINEGHSHFDEDKKNYNKNKPSSSIPVRCRLYEFRDAYGNCRNLKRNTFLKGLFSLLKIMRMKND